MLSSYLLIAFCIVFINNGLVFSQTELPQEVPQICYIVEIDVTIIVAHLKCCNMYIICTYRVIIILTCPDGTYFNPDTQVCDFKENVVCLHDEECSSSQNGVYKILPV